MAERREDLRAADADREFVAERLRAALNEGRLGLSEYDDRLREAYAARTYGDLDRLLDDLPAVVPPEHSQVAPVAPTPSPAVPAQPVAPPAAPAQPVTPPAAGRRALSGWLIGVWSAWLIAVSVNVVIWLLVSVSAGKAVYFWPMWVAGPWGTVLFVITFLGIARGASHPAPPTRREAWERKAERWERRAARNRMRWERHQARWQRRVGRGW